MAHRMIDSHIHLDHYEEHEITQTVADLENVHCTHLITVSYDLASCRKNLQFAERYPQVKPAFGFHPEQELPSEQEQSELFQWMEEHVDEMVAVGEIGLPYYLRKDHPELKLAGYVDLVEKFLVFAKKWDKPVVLHAVYEDAAIACGLLEKHQIQKAHFHWFKGDAETIRRMINNKFMISITPDVLYEREIQKLVTQYPLELMMVETDGPWPFEGKFARKRTHPEMIHASVSKIAELKDIDVENVYEKLYENTTCFYGLE
ncbi:TatD family hydrolase [Bacillus niameyensis]|uniref:TatD family hydrolase n=1 Tax=Bacillus niameyensis TaxID=1522308 RepID=UPI000786418B|nr:TatD family hydrolase [Bacillus niameyensis]